MAKRRTLPVKNVTFSIISEGTQLSSTIKVVQLSIDQGIDKLPSAHITLLEDYSSGKLELSNGELLIPGKILEILIGYNSEETKIFEGFITKHGIEMQKDRVQLSLELKDPAIQMAVKRENRTFLDFSDAEIAESLIQKYPKLSFDIDPSGPTQEQMVQYYCSDWDFIISRSKANGKFVFVENGHVNIFNSEFDQTPILELSVGKNIIRFEAEINAETQFEGSSSTSWDFSKQSLLEKNAQDPGIDFPGNISSSELASSLGMIQHQLHHGGKRKEEEIQKWADSDLMRNRLSKIIGTVKIQGTEKVKPGDLVSLKGFGDRFGGLSFVSSVRHEVTENKWFTILGLGLPLAPEPIESSNALIPGIRGLHFGKVSTIENDPEGEYRVKVLIPIIENESDGIWARMAMPDAGPSRGFYFYPEIGDEVIVGFVNEDPRDAVVLGKLYSSARPAPLESSDDNHQKGIFTRSGMKMIFHDEQVSLKIETPRGNILQISEEESGIFLRDENGNQFQMSENGVEIYSPTKLTLKSEGDIEIEGTNIEIKASASINAEGSASAALRSSGVTEVKGSIVQIN
ncbi:type VI secretion system tip protein VgrG [Algoriphagus kandeliae]|uniref:Type VI secretion system tip protein VgrG n=1 Tax=Algoriphagus kandeliae TaxID=2562278 RepID=A0A4Y9QX69_9BACT|nr:type VI secretion system tip protein VgrG [Algoriphagus kandeliae]TFV95545.1 type VI secretion system tip protein VgrG [Algoriphagus kandeliae]